AAPLGIDRSHIAVDDALVNSILEVTGLPWLVPQPLTVRFVLTEQQLGWGALGMQVMDAKPRGLCAHESRRHLLYRRPPRAGLPAPGIAEPELRQHMDGSRLRPTVLDRDPQQNVAGLSLRVLDEYVEIAVRIEEPAVDELKFRLADAP